MPALLAIVGAGMCPASRGEVWIAAHWEDLLRVAGSLQLGTVSASELLRALGAGARRGWRGPSASSGGSPKRCTSSPSSTTKRIAGAS